MKKRILFSLLILLIAGCSSLFFASCFWEKHVHEYGEWIEIRQPTCTESGLRERTCACGAKQTDTVLATGHQWGKPPTCTQPQVCTACGKEYRPALGHHYRDHICTRCGDILPSEDIYFLFTELEDGSYSVAKAPEEELPSKLYLPEEHLGRPVTAVAASGFLRCVSLEMVHIPESITSIGAHAFESCLALTDMTLPQSVTNIGEHAFAGCHSLALNDLPQNLRTVGAYAFENCSSLASLSLPENVTSVGEEAFAGCFRLQELTLPEGLERLGEGAFRGCSLLTSIRLPASLSSIGTGAFAFCPAIRTIEVEAGNERYSAIGNCLIERETKRLIAGCAESAIPADGSVTAIGAKAFSGCTSLRSAVLPEGITAIEEEAFGGCNALGDISLPASLTAIGDYAFADCAALTKIVIPESVAAIGEGCFLNCSLLGSTELPQSLRSIGSLAFYWCLSLETIVIPAQTASIGANAFFGCFSLQTARFEAPSGWSAAGEALSADLLSDAQSAAEALAMTNYSAVWTRGSLG